MTGHEDREFAGLDAYVRTQLAEAAETYASRIDIGAKLRAVLEAGRENHTDGVAATDS